jgi:hypothetical protein
MSGLVFTLLLTAASLAMLGDAFERMGFRRIGEDGWRGRMQEEDWLVDVFIKRIGGRLHLLLPDASIPREICERIVRSLSARLYALLEHQPFRPEYVEVVGSTPSFCHYCLEEVYMPYRCHRCGGYYCSEHRFPWRHDCPGDEGEAKATIRIEETLERKKRQRRRILVREVPCG